VTANPDPFDPLEALQEKLQSLQARLADLRELERIAQLSPEQWAEIQAEASQLEQRLQAYVLEVFNTARLRAFCLCWACFWRC
jgi:L-lysine 2,3-aminomutase